MSNQIILSRVISIELACLQCSSKLAQPLCGLSTADYKTLNICMPFTKLPGVPQIRPSLPLQSIHIPYMVRSHESKIDSESHRQLWYSICILKRQVRNSACSRTLFLLVYVCPGSVISLSAFVGSTAGCPPVLLVTFDLDSSLIVPSPPPGTLEVLSDHDSFCKAILVIPRACHLLYSAKQHETTTTVNRATLKNKTVFALCCRYLQLR